MLQTHSSVCPRFQFMHSVEPNDNRPGFTLHYLQKNQANKGLDQGWRGISKRSLYNFRCSSSIIQEES